MTNAPFQDYESTTHNDQVQEELSIIYYQSGSNEWEKWIVLYFGVNSRLYIYIYGNLSDIQTDVLKQRYIRVSRHACHTVNTVSFIYCYYYCINVMAQWVKAFSAKGDGMSRRREQTITCFPLTYTLIMWQTYNHICVVSENTYTNPHRHTHYI